MHLVDLDPERVGQRAPARACGPAARSGARAAPCRAPAAPASRARRARTPARSTRVSKRALCATSTRPSSSSRELGQHLRGRRRAVDHRLRDAGEALDPARQRPLRPHERVEGLVQLAAAHQHGAHLGQLAQVAAEAVGLGVDREELGAGARAARADPRTTDATADDRRVASPRAESEPGADWNEGPELAACQGAKPSAPRLSLDAMARSAHRLRLLRLRAREPQVARALPRLRRVEHARRGGRAPAPAGRGGRAARSRRAGAAPVALRRRRGADGSRG